MWRIRTVADYLAASAPSPTVILFALFGIEAIIFYVKIAIWVAPYYPPVYDQVGYLTAAYDLRDAIQIHGLAAALIPLSQPFTPNTVLFPLEGALLSLVVGFPRAGMLTVNLLAFLSLQAALFFLFKRLSQSAAIGLVAVIQVIVARTLFNSAGGIFDFRIDFLAFCAYGLWVCAVLRAGVFRLFGWSVVAGIAAAFLILNRMLSSVYLGATYIILLVTFACLAWFLKDQNSRLNHKIRMINIIASGLTILLLCIYPIINNFKLMYDYYYVSMFVSSEKEIRASELGLHTLIQHLSFYPVSLISYHLGIPWLIFICILLGVWMRRANGQGRRDYGISELRANNVEFAFLLVSIFIPLVILNFSISKSGLISNVLSTPVVCAVTFAFAAFARAGNRVTNPAGALNETVRRQPSLLEAYLLLFLALGGFAAGAAFQRSGPELQSREAINRLHDAIIEHEAGIGNFSPSVSVDRVADYMNAPVLQVRAYEKFNLRLHPSGLLGHSIFATTRDGAIAELAASDVIVLTESHGRSLNFPMNAQIESYWQDLWTWTIANRVALATEQIDGIRHTVFVRPFAAVPGR